VCATICNPAYVDSVNEMVRAANCPNVARLVQYCLKANPSERPMMSDVESRMSTMPVPDQQLLLGPIQRVVRRRAATAGDGADRKEAECIELRQNVANLQAQLKASEKLVEQLASSNAVIEKIYDDSAENMRRAQAAEKKAADAENKAADAEKKAADAEKEAAGWKRLARKRKNSMLKAKKDSVALVAEPKRVKRDLTNQRSGSAPIRRRAAQLLPTADAVNVEPVERPSARIVDDVR
ncbi:hypothetical protein AAVH_21873, partial [Aphelenchoides avenae]